MASISLRNRQTIIVIGVLGFVLPILYVAVTSAFYQTEIGSARNRLEASIYSIIGEIEFVEQELVVTPSFLPPEFNQVNSGVMAFVINDDNIVWRSDSALSSEVQPASVPLEAGQTDFFLADSYFNFVYALRFDVYGRSESVTIHLMMNESLVTEQVNQFSNTLMKWFFYAAVFVFISFMVGLWAIVSPLRALNSQVKRIEAGASERVEGSYPLELERIKNDLNLLLGHQERQRERYRGYLSDLAHALKTPVAVLKSSPLADDHSNQEQLQRITNIIEHQLKRAASAGNDSWKRQTKVKPIIDKIVSAMKKIYRDKNLQFDIHCANNAYFLGDEEDMMEILGNLIDNSSKACHQKIVLSVQQNSQDFMLHVEDDGPGIPQDQRDKLLGRGQRLDTYTEGHGVGMAIVNDIVRSYKGTMTISESTLGGAKFELVFGV